MSTIITRNSANSGSQPSSLIQGELAINVTDGKLFYGSGSGNVVKEFTGSGGGGGTIDTGSFATTGSNIFIGNQIISGSLHQSGTFYPDQIDWFSSSIGYDTGSYILTTTTNGLTTYANYPDVANALAPHIPTVSSSISASYALTASYALNAESASYALNGGVTQLLAGPNISLSPTNGTGQVTVSSTPSGGGFNTATGSYGSFYDTTIQTNVASTARSMSLNTTDITNGVSISGSTNPFNTYIKVANAGVYDIQFSAQVDKTDSGTDEIWIWIRKNGIDISDSATSVQLTGNGAHYVAAWNFFVNAAAGDYFQLMWYSPDANVRLHAESAFGIVPGIPSLIVTANRVDQFLSNTGSFSGSFTGDLLGTASYATQALSASWAPGGAGTPTFPYTGSAIISGSLEVTGSLNVSAGFTGSLQGTASYAVTSSYALNSGGSAAWGGITGTLSTQTDLQTALNAKPTSKLAATGSNIGGVTGNFISTNSLLPANTLVVGTPCMIHLKARGRRVSGASGTITSGIYRNTIISTTGSIFIGQATMTTTNTLAMLERHLLWDGVANISVITPATGVSDLANTGTFSTTIINPAIDNYFLFTISNTNLLDTGQIQFGLYVLYT
jgi:hypothetical protein